MPKRKLTQRFVDRVTLPADQRKVDYFDRERPGLMLEVRHSGRTYYLRYTNPRKKTCQKKLACAVTLSLQQARQLAQDKLARLALGEDPFESVNTLSQIPTFKTFVETTYLPYAQRHKRSSSTDESLIRNHLLPSLGGLYLDELKRHHFLKVIQQHQLTHKPASSNRLLVLCRSMMNLALKWELPGLTNNPTQGIDLLPVNNHRERYLSQEESQRLFTALETSGNPQLKWIVAWLLLTGARRREVLQARWEDLDVKARIWTVAENKTGQTRYLPISDGLMNLIQQQLNQQQSLLIKDQTRQANASLVLTSLPSGWVFTNPKTGRPFVNIFKAWDQARQQAGLSEVRMHDLRHSFASYLINAGRSLYEVQKILGHHQIKTTQRYAHLSQHALVNAADAASDLVQWIANPPGLEKEEIEKKERES